MMEPDDEVCLCFHVTRRKLENWIRLERPHVPAQLSECFGAGTGCGWCRPFLKRLFAAAQAAGHTAAKSAIAAPLELPSASEYAVARQQYIREGKGTPPAGSANQPES